MGRSSIRTTLLATSLVLLASLLAACPVHRRSPVAAPADEVWLDDSRQDGAIEVAVVGPRRLASFIHAPARVAFADDRVASIVSPVHGRVRDVFVGLGDPVNKGDPLLMIQSPEIGMLSAELEAARSRHRAAQHAVARERAMWQGDAGHATSEERLQAAETALVKASHELERLRSRAASLRIDGSGVTQQLVLLSPITGQILDRNVEPGAEVQGQYAGGSVRRLLALGDLSTVVVIAQVPQVDLARVSVGSKALIEVVAHPHRVFETQVDWISDVLDPTTRTARVRCTIENRDGTLLPEMYALARIETVGREALAIAASAVITMGDTQVVFLDRGRTPDGRRRFERVPIRTEVVDDEPAWLIVRHGVEDGALVVTQGAPLLASLR